MADLGFLESREKVHTFQEAADIFLVKFQKKINDGKKKSSLLVRYNSLLKRSLLPQFGKRDIATIQDFEIENWLENSGYSTPKIEIILVVLTGVFGSAKRHRWITVVPLKDVRKNLDLQKNKVEKQIFTHEEVERILKSTSPDHYLFYLMALRTGMRLGELLALIWNDISLDEEKESVSIDKAFRLEVSTPKTKQSIRTIGLSGQLIAELKKVKAQKRPFGKDLLFPGKGKTKHISQGTSRNRWMSLFKKAGVSYRNFHTIRHTTISHLFALGVALLTVSKMAGHYSASFTIDVYGHAVPNNEKPCANLLEEAQG